MAGSIAEFMSADHRRLDALLRQATAVPPAIDRKAYAEFRTGLLRHIALEEKILIPAVRRARGEPLDWARRLRHEHGAIALLLVPSPDAALASEIRSILEPHNRLEEGPGGLYEICDALPDADRDQLRQRMEAYPAVAVAPHNDGPGVHRTAAEALRISGRQSAVRDQGE